MGKFWKWLRYAPELLLRIKFFEMDIAEAQSDPVIKAKIEADPALDATARRLSADWRAVMEAADRLR